MYSKITKLIRRKNKTLFILCILFIGCNQTKDKSVLTIAISSDIRGFDPALAVDIRTGSVISLVYDNLVRFDDGNDLLPCVAKEWSVNKKGDLYLFSLDTTAQFHDGKKINAKAVAYSITRVLDPKTSSPQTWLFERIVGAEEFMDGLSAEIRGLKALDNNTLQIEIKKPFAPFIQYLAMPSAAIVNPSMVENIGNVPSGSGPWILEKWEKDGEIIFRKNKEYWGKPAKMSRLKLRILPTILTQSAEFTVGNIDLFDIPALELLEWKQDEDWTENIFSLEELNIWYIAMNCSRPPFNDIRVRKAMNLALDREKILHLLLAGMGTLSSGPVPPGLLSVPAHPPYPYNPKRALELLNSAGYENGFHTKLWVGGGSETFHVLEAFQSNWERVGITVEILKSDWNVFKTSVRAGQPDLYYLDWFADYPDGENFLFPLFHSAESMIKRNRYSNPEVDNLIERIQSMPFGKGRDRLIVKTNNLLYEEVPWIYLWHGQTHIVTQPGISGYQPKAIFNAERYTEIFRQ